MKALIALALLSCASAFAVNIDEYVGWNEYHVCTNCHDGLVQSVVEAAASYADDPEWLDLVHCWSGGYQVVAAWSDGTVDELAGVLRFNSYATGKQVVLTGDCRVLYDAKEKLRTEPPKCLECDR